jgi:hypothetical protein
MLFFCSHGCTTWVRTVGVVRRGGGPALPLIRVGCSRTFARHHTLSDDPHVDADTPTVDSEVRNSYLLFISVRHGYPWVPTNQGPRGPCQVDPTCQKPRRPASGPRDLIHNPGDLGNTWKTLSRSRKTCRASGESFSLDHGGSTASRPEDRGILSVITEGDLP